jgi:hypothetical protein
VSCGSGQTTLGRGAGGTAHKINWMKEHSRGGRLLQQQRCGTVYAINWLQVLGTAERSQIAQRVGHHLHPLGSRLEAFTSEQQPRAFGFPRTGPLDPQASGLEHGVEQPLAPTLGALAVAGMRREVGEQARMQKARALAGGSTATIEVHRGASQVPANLLGSLLPRFPARWAQAQSGLMAGRPRDRREDVAVVLRPGADVLPVLGFVPRVPHPSAPVVATVWVPSPWSPRRASGCAAARGRPLAPNARHSDPSSAPLATTVYTVVAGLAGVPLVSWGMGRHFYCLPGSSTQKLK